MPFIIRARPLRGKSPGPGSVLRLDWVDGAEHMLPCSALQK